jgi:hypothetical protein
MIRAFCRALAALILIALVAPPLAARATVVVDPTVLYQQMKTAYDKGTADGWTYRSQQTYLASIFNAGRAYSLQYPTDPAYGELATLTVQIGSGLHYDPLTNHDAAVWWVREAADWVAKNSQDPTLVGQAQSILQRVNSETEPEALARFADQDATANLQNYPTDVDAVLQQLEADWRAWLLTGDKAWRSLAFQRAAQPDFPVSHLPTTYGNEVVNSAQAAADGGDGYTSADTANARKFLTHLHAVDPLRVISSVTSMPHSAYLSTLAPADEYFGRLGFSILGIENQLKHINYMLDYNYGDRESGETVLVAESIDDMHKVYPRDRDLPMLLYWAYTTLGRMSNAESKEAAKRLRAILTVEYQDSPEAKKLLAGT